MAECIILKGGGGSGADLDVITAGAGDVLAGKVTVDKEGNPITGTMPANGGTYWNRDLQLGLESDNLYSFFPIGNYSQFDSRGALHRIPIARLQTAIGATPAKILSGQSVAGVAGGIAQMAGQTINPTASQQIVSTSGKYLTGNVTVNGVSNLTAANVKKGVNVGGTVGTWEGFVASSVDLYNRGAWGSITSSNLGPTWSDQGDYRPGTLRYDSAQIALVGASTRYSLSMLITKGFNTINYSYFNVTMLSAQSVTQFLRIECGTGYQASGSNKWEITNRLGDTGNISIGPPSSETTITLNLSSINSTVYFLLSMYPNTGISAKDFAYIKRIWFS